MKSSLPRLLGGESELLFGGSSDATILLGARAVDVVRRPQRITGKRAPFFLPLRKFFFCVNFSDEETHIVIFHTASRRDGNTKQRNIHVHKKRKKRHQQQNKPPNKVGKDRHGSSDWYKPGHPKTTWRAQR